MKPSTNIPGSNDPSVDLLRIVASYFVVVIHSTGTAGNTALAWNVFARFSVPVFVLTSGYFMLAKHRSIGEIMKKCGRCFLLMLFWSAVYLVYEVTVEGDSPNVVVYLLTEPFHLWYLYATMGLYLLTPVVQVFTRNASEPEYRYGLILTFLLGSVVTLLCRLDSIAVLSIILDRMKIPYTTGFLFLYLLGGYFRKYGVRHSSAWIACGVLASVLAVLAALAGSDVSLMQSFFSSNAIFAAAGGFALVKRIHISENSVLRGVAECTQGIYLIHPMVILIMQQLGITISVIPVYAAVVHLTALCITALLRRIPGFGRIIV